ncbi:hypothetical protein [Paludisphaera rhizosphaerae]|uniref:hypothetical protein n=1 Tax=Paludisphaera rhizosphaerae TaxID=2711216 RepID=UPI0013EB7639|nr:hypothetical protein [Paludisphaera rhizosphaerae]
MRSCFAVTVLLSLAPGLAPAQSTPPKPIEMTASPAAASAPSFKYPLLPSSARLIPGDAAPILLRLRFEVNDQDWSDMSQKTAEWNQKPLRDLPLPEVKAMVEKWQRRLDLLAIAARRQQCDWGYPIAEQRTDVINIGIADASTMRDLSRLQTLKARLDIAEGRFDDAARSIETGMAFARKVGKGPFLINALVGIAMAAQTLAVVEDWIAAPNSPNLYWSLTALPTPLVDTYDAFEQERALASNVIPELVSDDLPETPEGWTLRLAAMYDRMRKLTGQLFPELVASAKAEAAKSGDHAPDRTAENLKSSLGANLSEYRRKHLATFRKTLADHGGLPADRIAAMTDDEAAARGLILGFRILWDRLFEPAYLTLAEAEGHREEYERETRAAQEGPFALFASIHASALGALQAEARLPRRVAMLRTVEAVRMYAAAHEGRLPASLGDVHEAPVPVDPVSGSAFLWKVDGDVATLAAPTSPKMWSQDYRIVIRKK